MERKLIFATNNHHKVAEIRLALPGLSILSLKEAGWDIDIPEPYDTLEENARAKASTIFKLSGCSCFSEDSGLEVFSLNNEPGVHSARYAGNNRSFEQNIAKLLDKLATQTNRNAQFRAVICLILNGEEHYFEGLCKGKISIKPKGKNGFGYDPVFIPDGQDKTFAEMLPEQKAKWSHRKLAADKLVTFLNKLNQRN